MKAENLRAYIRDIPDFPQKGVLFRDITPLLRNYEAFATSIELMAESVSDWGVTAVAAVEARGFIWGATLAQRLGVGFIPMRKPGKLPYKTLEEEYALEYGVGKLQVHVDAAGPQDSVLIVDDVLATGGTAAAAANLIRKLGAGVAGFAFLIRLEALGGYEALVSKGERVSYLLKL